MAAGGQEDARRDLLHAVVPPVVDDRHAVHEESDSVVGRHVERIEPGVLGLEFPGPTGREVGDSGAWPGFADADVEVDGVEDPRRERGGEILVGEIGAEKADRVRRFAFVVEKVAVAIGLRGLDGDAGIEKSVAIAVEPGSEEELDGIGPAIGIAVRRLAFVRHAVAVEVEALTELDVAVVGEEVLIAVDISYFDDRVQQVLPVLVRGGVAGEPEAARRHVGLIAFRDLVGVRGAP